MNAKHLHGNQHNSRKRIMLRMLAYARSRLNVGDLVNARAALRIWREDYALVPASTRRRWKAGR